MRDDDVEVMRFGRYVVVDFLGAGGMGQVLRARDPKLDREVAIKVVREPGAETTARLLREARTMAALSHPNVVPIYDVDTDGTEVFIAMELVDGVTLRQWLAKTSPPWRTVLSVFIDAAHGLTAAHEAGLVHRDFKPDNVMLEPSPGVTGDEDGRPRRVMVMDFGLARSTGAATTLPQGPLSGRGTSRPDDRLTRTGDVIGTPLYIAPEQLSGAPATPASDQYAFCIALYQALFGIRPFDGSTFETLAVQKLGERVSLPPATTPVPRRVFSVLQRGLRADPNARWPSMRALVGALRSTTSAPGWRRPAAFSAAAIALLVAGGVVAREPPPCREATDAAKRAWNRQRHQQLTSAFAASQSPQAAEATTLVHRRLDDFFARWQTHWEATCDAVGDGVAADMRRACLRSQARDAEALVDVLVDADADIVEHSVQAVSALPDPAVCDRPQQHKRNRSPAIADDVAHYENVLSKVDALWSVGRSDAGLELLQRELPGLQALGDCPLSAEASLWRARLQHDQGRYEDAVDGFQAAFFEATGCERHDVAIQAARYLVGIHGHVTSDLEEAEVWYGHARSQLPHVSESQIEEAVLSYTYVPVLERTGRTEQALELMQRARSLLEPLREQHSRLWVEYLTNEAAVLTHTGRFDEALVSARESIERAEAQYGARHPKVAMAYGNLGVIYHSLSRFEEAATAHQQAADLMPLAFGPEHPHVVKSLVSLAQVQTMAGRWEDAEANVRRALELAERVLPPDSSDTNRVLRTIAQMRSTRGDPKEALVYQQRVVDAQQRTGVRDHVYVWDLMKLAEWLTAVGRHDEARARLDEALELHQADAQFDRKLSGQLYATLASLHHARGDAVQAEATFGKAIAFLEPIAEGRLYELGEVLEAYGEFLLDTGRFDDATVALRRCGEIYGASGSDPEDAARIHELLARAASRNSLHDR